jgi:hypothetical protein
MSSETKTKQTISEAFNPQAKYADWTTAAGRQILMPTFVNRRVSRGQRGGSHTAVNLSFLDRSLYFSFKSSSFMLTRLGGPRSRTSATQQIW